MKRRSISDTQVTYPAGNRAGPGVCGPQAVDRPVPRDHGRMADRRLESLRLVLRDTHRPPDRPGPGRAGGQEETEAQSHRQVTSSTTRFPIALLDRTDGPWYPWVPSRTPTLG